MNQPDEQNIRKRILLFYFAAGINLCMAMYVFAAGAMQGGGSLTLIAFVFLAFAALNFYVARMLRKRLDAFVRGRQPN
jgi:F0F1-type ATP synthase assembly protein I